MIFLGAFFPKIFKTKYTTEKSEIRRFQGAFQGLDSSIGKWFGRRRHMVNANCFKIGDFWPKNRFFFEIFFPKSGQTRCIFITKKFFYTSWRKNQKINFFLNTSGPIFPSRFLTVSNGMVFWLIIKKPQKSKYLN